MSSPELDEGLLDEETAITELTFLPDGRLCLFGASKEIFELLAELKLGDAAFAQRFSAMKTAGLIPHDSTERVSTHV